MAKIVLGQNDLQSMYPELCEEWDYEKNTITPDKVSSRSGKKIFWSCFFGHEWKATVASRTLGSQCPKCIASSFPEQALYFYLKDCFSDCLFQDGTVIGQELDIFIPSIKTAIEYDGIQWHKNRNVQDLKKTLLCKGKGIRLIRIREEGLAPILQCQNMIRKAPFTNDTLDEIISELFRVLETTATKPIDTKSDALEIKHLYQFWFITEKSFAAKCPKLIKEWHPVKNNGLSPEIVSAGAKRKVWWICSIGHEWEALVYSRARGVGCPYCSNYKVLSGYNDLATTHPFLIAEWDFDKNEKKPSECTAGSSLEVWWKCPVGHSFKRNIYHKILNPSCPYCNNHAVLSGYNDLATRNPTLAAEWHPYKNKQLSPSDVTVSSQKKIWWLGKCGHEWEASVADRARGNGCPICSGRKVLAGCNDLESQRPELLKEWDYEKNTILPSEITANSHKKVWWICSQCGNSYQTSPNLKRKSCRLCKSKKMNL